MARKCSHCGNKGHNSRTCSNPRSLIGDVRLKLFGVQLSIPSCPIRKSSSMDCLASSSYLTSSSSSPSSPATSLVSIDENTDKVCSGYLSDDLMGRAQERKKGQPPLSLIFFHFYSAIELFLRRRGSTYACFINYSTKFDSFQMYDV